MISGRFASRIIATVRSSAEAGATGRSTGCGSNRAASFFGGDVLGQFEMHRPGPFFDRDPEGIAHDGRYRRGRNDLTCHLGQRAHGADDIHDLEACLPRAFDRLLARDHQHRHGAEIGIGGGRGEIQRPGAEGRKANAGTAGQTPLGRRHESRSLLVPRQHQFDLRMPKGFQDVQIFLARERVNAIDAFVFQCRNQQIGAFGHRSAPRCPGGARGARTRSDHATGARRLQSHRQERIVRVRTRVAHG